MAADNEIKVLLTAEIAQLQAGMDAGAASVAQTTEAMKASIAEEAAAFNAAVQAKIDAQMRLNAAFADSINTTQAIAEAESALDQAMGAGAITASEYTGYVSRLEAAEADMAVSTEAATAAVTENTVALGINGGVARELGVMIGELARGNYTRLEGSTVTLANRTGLLSSALQFLISPAGLAAEALAALAIAAYEASDDEDKLREAIINTGNASGFSTDQMRTMEQALRDTGATAAQAREAVLAVASSGNLLGANFENAAQAAVDMAQLTGISVDKAVAQISRLQDDPVKAIMKLNETMNFLSPTEASEIKHLQDIGDKAGAASLAIADLAEAERKRIKEQNDEGGGASSFTGKLKAAASAVLAGAKGIFAPDTLKEQLDQINKEITEYAADSPGAITQDNNNKIHVNKDKMPSDLYEQVNRLLQQRAEIEAKITAEDERQRSVSAQVAANKAKVNAALSAPKPKATKADHDQAQADRDGYNAERLQHDMSLAEEKRYWEAKKDAAKDGTQAYRQAVQQLLDIKTKEAAAGRQAARQEAAEARKSAAEQMNSLAMVRDGTAANTAERIQTDAAILASATKLYGADSAQQKAALAQMLSDEKSYDAQVVKERQLAEKEKLDAAISAAQDQMRMQQEKINTELALGQISQKQEIALLASANDAEYASEQDALKKYQATLDQKTQAYAASLKAMEALQAKHQQAVLKSNDDMEKATLLSWQKALRPIDNAFQQSINGMIQGTQTFKKGLDNILLSIVASYAQTGIHMVMNWIANEGAKTSASAAGAAERSTIEAASAAQSKATDAATGKSQITSAAATGAAKAYQAIVGIPYVGPILAPIAAGVAFAGIEAFSGQLASARGGWERVPFDGAMTELHKDEMVLPANIANPMRQMAKQGGQGGSPQVHVHTTDPRSFKDYMRRNPAAIASAIKNANRRGHFAVGVR